MTTSGTLSNDFLPRWTTFLQAVKIRGRISWARMASPLVIHVWLAGTHPMAASARLVPRVYLQMICFPILTIRS